MLYVLASLALPALMVLVAISIYQPALLAQHPWIDYLFWASLGVGVFQAARDLGRTILDPLPPAHHTPDAG
ncbi:MAG: hypothetical protein QNJ87_12550 [Gammaproteobacteria bacterium]|nr:hypothetical protein [Gammaproteobacteria bacterium]MDJ0872585.1 hypothetical protein [Gammaproteobacteria bacterium]